MNLKPLMDIMSRQVDEALARESRGVPYNKERTKRELITARMCLRELIRLYVDDSQSLKALNR